MLSKTPPTVYLVAIDETQTSARALEVGCTLGAALGGDAELHVIHVIGVTPSASVMGTPPLVSPTDLLEAGRVVLDRAVAEAGHRFKGRITGHLAHGEPWREIVQMASNLRVDLAFVGTAGRTGIKRIALGSVAERVVRHAGCPVLVVRPKDYHAHVEPGIEPPCGDCLAVQNKTQRAQLWCERHSERHPHGRLHYETPPTFAVGSMNFRP
jgi:nucleotide-binding universal stress UspA family protein